MSVSDAPNGPLDDQSAHNQTPQDDSTSVTETDPAATDAPAPAVDETPQVTGGDQVQAESGAIDLTGAGNEPEQVVAPSQPADAAVAADSTEQPEQTTVDEDTTLVPVDEVAERTTTSEDVTIAVPLTEEQEDLSEATGGQDFDYGAVPVKNDDLK